MGYDGQELLSNVNSVRVDDWTTERTTIASNGQCHLSTTLQFFVYVLHG